MISNNPTPLIAKKWNYYNDNDPKAAAWTKELIKRGLVAPGEVDERSILDVRADDLLGFTQCHWFCGVAGWSYALRLAGWPDDRPVWTGSPPCQPFSAAGKQLGRDDPRHLAPHFLDLVRACRPRLLFGEQVASADVFGGAAKPSRKNAASPPQWAWLDDLQDRLEAAHYAVGSSDLPSAGVGAPHIRQRTFFGAIRMADADDAGSQGWGQPGRECATECAVGSGGVASWMADADGGNPGTEGLQRGGQHRQQPQDGGIGWMADAMRAGWSEWGAGAGDGQATGSRGACGLADADRGQCGRLADGERRQCDRAQAGWQQGNGKPTAGGEYGGTNARDGFWDAADWLYCRDGKWRPTQRAVLGMADGIPGVVVPSGPIVPASFPLAQKQERRTMRLRGYGNAINPILAAEFIGAFTDAMKEAKHG